jgi:hypothetical protein
MVSPGSNKVSYEQVQALLKLIGDMHPTGTTMQRLLESSNLIKAIMDCSDIKQVNVQEVIRLLNEPNLPITWNDPGKYLGWVMECSRARGWELDENHSENYLTGLELGQALGRRQAEDLMNRPSVHLWLGKDIAFDWNEMVTWLRSALREHGIAFKNEVAVSDLRLFKPSQQPDLGRPVVRTTRVDLNLLDIERGQYLEFAHEFTASLDIFVLLALNAHVVLEMGRKLPTAFAIPGFYCKDRTDKVPALVREKQTLKLCWVSRTK